MGYVPSEELRDIVDPSYIALDAFFIPFNKVLYYSEKMLV